MMMRCEEPGWFRIGRWCSAERRSLWARLDSDSGAVELCAGREGDDAYVRVERGDAAHEGILDVVTYAKYATET